MIISVRKIISTWFHRFLENRSNWSTFIHIYHTKTGYYFIPDSKFHYFSIFLLHLRTILRVKTHRAPARTKHPPEDPLWGTTCAPALLHLERKQTEWNERLEKQIGADRLNRSRLSAREHLDHENVESHANVWTLGVVLEVVVEGMTGYACPKCLVSSSSSSTSARCSIPGWEGEEEESEHASQGLPRPIPTRATPLQLIRPFILNGLPNARAISQPFWGWWRHATPVPPSAPTRPLAELTRRRGVDAATARRRLVDGKRLARWGLALVSRLLVSERVRIAGDEDTWASFGARFEEEQRTAWRASNPREPRKWVGESHWRAITAKREEQIGCETFLLVYTTSRGRVAISRLFSPSQKVV